MIKGNETWEAMLDRLSGQQKTVARTIAELAYEQGRKDERRKWMKEKYSFITTKGLETEDIKY